MGKLGTVKQFFDTVKKAPIAGKFMQRTGNFLQRNFNPLSTQGQRQTLRNLSPKTRANLKDFDRSLVGDLSDATRTMFANPTVRNLGRGLLGVGIADDLSKGNYGSAATEAAFFAPGKTLGALKTAGRMAAPFVAPAVPYVLGAGALFAAAEGLAPARVADATLDALTPEERKAYEAEIRSQQENMSPSQKRTMGITPEPSRSFADNLPPELLPPQYNRPESAGIPIHPGELEKYRVRPGAPMYGTIPPSVNDDLPGQNYDPSVTLPGAPTAPYVPATTLTPDPVPPTPTPDIGQAMDPYAYQLNVYGQGRQDAATQSSQAAVRDLGLSIHRQLHPNLYKNDGPKTPLQEPSTMNNLDAVSELDASTRAVEELIDPTILAQLNAMNLRRSGY